VPGTKNQLKDILSKHFIASLEQTYMPSSGNQRHVVISVSGFLS
jgi:hypothetical protein